VLVNARVNGDNKVCYAAVDAPDYLSMLTQALRRHRGEP
jgi:hypothetical protein